MAKNHRSIVRRLFPTAHKMILKRIIDKKLGCLTGNVLVVGAGQEPYNQLMPNAERILITDVAPYPGIDQVADAHKLPFADNSFDHVIAIEVFEHLSDPRLAASEVCRVLVKDGTALVSVPFMFRVHGDPYDFYRYTRSGLKQIFALFQSANILGFGNRLHAISDIITTASHFFVPLRLINHLIAFRFLSCSSDDCPSGYVVELKK